MLKCGDMVTADASLKRAGTIRVITRANAVVLDMRTKQTWIVPLDECLVMSPNEQEKFYKSPLHGDPDPQVALKRKLQVVAGWTNQDKGARFVGKL